MKILIINLYSSKKRFARFKKRFKKIFKGKTRLVFKHWKEISSIIKAIKSKTLDGIILSGSDLRIKSANRSIIPSAAFESGLPLLGICYGYQYMIKYFTSDASIGTFEDKRYHKYSKHIAIKHPFIVPKTKRFFYHHDYITKLPKQWKSEVTYKNIIFMSYNPGNKYVGIQFHPERYIKTAKIFFSAWLKYIRA